MQPPRRPGASGSHSDPPEIEPRRQRASASPSPAPPRSSARTARAARRSDPTRAPEWDDRLEDPATPRSRRASTAAARGQNPPFLLEIAGGISRKITANIERVRMVRSILFALAGLLLALSGALADGAIHRGVESGVEEPVVRHITGRDLAVNADLTRFSPDQLGQVADALQANGFRYVRQPFAWSEIEPAPGAFSWERYDTIVDTLNQRGITPIAVIQRSPAWARASAGANAFDAPPADLGAWERLTGTLAARYGDRVPFIQLWDLPNRSDHWGDAPPDAAAYVNLLARGSNAARAGNPNVSVVMAEFDPGAGADDLAFLRQAYAVGAAPFFDVAAARVAGGDRTPYDRRTSPTTPGLSRAILFRDVMVAAGDLSKPVWATHYGWTLGSPGSPGIDAATRSAWTVAGIERARSEWPWMGPMFAWGFAPGATLGGDVSASETLLTAEGVPTDLFGALGAFNAAGGTVAAPTGFLPVSASQITYEGSWDLQHLGDQQYRTTAETGARLTVPFVGTGASARVRLSRQAADLAATLDGQPVEIDLGAFQAADITLSIARGLPDARHEFSVALTSPGSFTIGGVLVERAIPLRWPIVLLVGAGTALLAVGLRGIFAGIAVSSGRLVRRGRAERSLDMPILPDWKPARRA
ncbi:MAG: beta-galactosidase [Thermomicrobiales bacterium]